MSFPALDFADRAKKAELSELYGVRGIPCLVLLDAEGNLITKEGRSVIGQTPFDDWHRLPEIAKEKAAAEAALLASLPDSISKAEHAHPLNKTARPNGYGCDVCKKGQAPGTSFCCKQCDFDCCLGCAK